MNNEEVLELLCLTPSPSGREHWIYPSIKQIFEPFGDVYMGKINNIYIHKEGNGRGKVMIMAHADEVFLMVTDILENGFLKFKGNGIDPKTLVSQEVTIHGSEVITGIIGIKPPHLMSDDEKKKGISTDELLIDTGYSQEKISKKVNVGDYVTINREFYKLLNNNVVCKAIDDRAGIAAMYACAEELKNVNHDMDVYFVCSSQEEVGHRGAKVGAYEINPDIAIAIDVTFDGGVLGDTDRENKLGGGPVVCIGPNIHPKVREKLLDIAEEYGMSYQVEVEPGSTGTDAWDIQIAREGVPTLLLSIPIKYMHTSVEMVNMDDIKNTGRIIAKLIERLNADELEGLFCF